MISRFFSGYPFVIPTEVEGSLAFPAVIPGSARDSERCLGFARHDRVSLVLTNALGGGLSIPEPVELTCAREFDKHKLIAMPRRAFFLSLCLLGATCMLFTADAVPAPAPADPALCGPLPKLYKEIIWNWMQSNLVDANSAKLEWDGEPKPVDVGKDGQHVYGWLVNFKVNARNQFGTYTGKQAHGAVIRDGQVIKTFGFGY
jgi:hypothetical protein